MVKIIKSEYEVLSPWVTLVTHSLDKGDSISHNFHSLCQSDYVSVFTLTSEGNVLLVKQFRPAINGYTLELPGGLIDPSEQPLTAAIRELAEETGHIPTQDLVLLGSLLPDTGRLENKLWGYYAEVKSLLDWKQEPHVELLIVTKQQLKNYINNGEFNHALHIALIGLAIMKGIFSFD